MGATKAIIFSTHILEEVDAACSRAIIIDRGRIVANGTPAELRRKSELAGAVTLRVSGVGAAALSARLYQIPQTRRVTVLEEKNGAVAVCVYPKPNAADGELPLAVGEAAQGWRIQQLQVEEGRLDSVTLPPARRACAAGALVRAPTSSSAMPRRRTSCNHHDLGRAASRAQPLGHSVPATTGMSNFASVPPRSTPMLTVVPGRWLNTKNIAPCVSTPCSAAPSIATT